MFKREMYELTEQRTVTKELKKDESEKGCSNMWRKLYRSALFASVFGILSVSPVFAGENVYVNCDVLRCRSTAEVLEDNIVGRVYRGDMLEKLGEEGTWTKISVNGQTCYAATKYLTEKAPAVIQAEAAEPVSLSAEWKYAEFSKINSGQAMLYRSNAAEKKNKVVCVNAGHGTIGGSSVKTQCHPDGSPKVTGGSTAAGATMATAVSSGMTFNDGTPEAKITLAMAKILKTRLLEEGYDVLMIRETDDVQLDNIARTVLANNKADCHIALHWDSSTSDKGAFYMSVPSDATYRAMEPVASHWQSHHHLGDSLIEGLRGAGVKIFSSGSMEIDLTQTSYSTIPSVDIELGDKASDTSEATLNVLAEGLVAGIDIFFK